MREAGVSGAEIVERGADAELANPAEYLARPAVVLEHDVLGHLELKQVRRKARLLQHRSNRCGQIARLKLRRRQVDAQPEPMAALLPLQALPAGAFDHPMGDAVRNR